MNKQLMDEENTKSGGESNRAVSLSNTSKHEWLGLVAYLHKQFNIEIIAYNSVNSNSFVRSVTTESDNIAYNKKCCFMCALRAKIL